MILYPYDFDQGCFDPTQPALIATFWEIDNLGNLESVDDAFCAAVGYAEDSLIGQPATQETCPFGAFRADMRIGKICSSKIQEETILIAGVPCQFKTTVCVGVSKRKFYGFSGLSISKHPIALPNQKPYLPFSVQFPTDATFLKSCGIENKSPDGRS